MDDDNTGMSTIIIYRVEDESGIGPYQSDWYDSSDLCSAHCDSLHPIIFEDVVRGFTENHLCGFSSLEKLESWFGDWLLILLDEGFRVVQYIVNKDDVLFGRSGRQVAFIPPKK